VPSGSRAQPLRVVSVLPAATEIVAELGALDSLVGISHQCRLPEGARDLPLVTSGAVDGSSSAIEIHERVAGLVASHRSLYALDAETIASLHPDVILTQALCDVCAVSEDDVRALATSLAPSPSVVTLGASTLDGVFDDIATVGEALGLAAESGRLLAALRARMRRVHDILAASRAPRPRVAVIEWTDPPFAAGHWVPEMVRRAGGTDVLAVAGQRSREVTWEMVADAAPGVVVIAPCGYHVQRAADEARVLLSTSEWFARRTVWAMDAVSLVSQPGPRLVEGIEVLAAICNPGLFPVPSTADAIPVSFA
jgi:iron complex transport system substrate-binding protein